MRRGERCSARPRPPSTSRRASPNARRGAPPVASAPGSRRRSTAYFAADRRDFLVSATPGAGKTTFALRLASELLQRRRHRPGHRRRAHRAPEDPVGGRRAARRHPARSAVQQQARQPGAALPRGRRHLRAGRRAGGAAPRADRRRRARSSSSTRCITAATRSAGATPSARRSSRPMRRLSLTGTPFRSDTAPIPFVTYLRDEHGIRLSQTDYAYGYGRALRDGVVRPVVFLSYAGSMRWRDSRGRGVRGQARPARHHRRHRAGLANGPRPGRRLDLGGAARCRSATDARCGRRSRMRRAS